MFAEAWGMRVIRPYLCSRYAAVFVAALAGSGMTACLAPAGDELAQAEVDKAMAAAEALEATGLSLEQADTDVGFDDGQEAESVPPFAYDYRYFIGTPLSWGHRDLVPVGRDWGWMPEAPLVAAFKLLTFLPDQIADLFRASDYYAWDIPAADTDRILSAGIKLTNLNWQLSRGKASLQLCRRDASQALACQDLGSVKEGARSIVSKRKIEMCFFFGWDCDWSIFWPVKFREYTRVYDLKLAKGQAYSLRLKHKLECTVREFHETDDQVVLDGEEAPSDKEQELRCIAEPSIIVQFAAKP